MRVYNMAKSYDDEGIDRSVYSTNYTEFTVKKDSDIKTILIRTALIIIYAGIVVGIWFIAWWLGAISVLIAAILCYFTWPMTCIEYEYTTSSGNWRFEKIYGGKRRSLVLEVRIKDMEIIAPYTEEYAAKYKKSIAKTYDFRKCSRHSEDIYFAVFKEKGKSNMILFHCTNKALKIFAGYNKEGTVNTDTLHH